MAGDPILDALRVVFPQINISTLGQVAMEFKDDLDSAAEFVIDNFGKLDDSDANKSEGHQQALDGIDIHVGVDPVDYNTGLNSVPFEVAENEDCLEQSMQPLAIASTSGQARLPEESHSDSLFPISQNSLVDDEVGHLGVNQKAVHCSDHIIEGYGDEQLRCSISKKKPGTAASQNDFPLHDDGSPDSALQSCCSVCLEDVDNTIATENDKKICLLSNMSAISEMLEEVELNEAKTKLVVSEASQAGNDIFVKVERLKEMSALENKKVAGEVLAENSIIASEAQGFLARVSNISEERNNSVLIIDEMHHTLQRRLAAVEAEREAAENEKIVRGKLAQKSLEVQEHLLEVVKEESKKLEQQALNNAKLRELLMNRSHVVDALQVEMREIFDAIAQLKGRLDTQLPVDEPLELSSSNLTSSVKSATSNISWSSDLQSNASMNDDTKMPGVSNENFYLDDTWDIVGDETIF